MSCRGRLRCLHGAHGGDVETEQTTSNDGDGCDEVDIAELLHVGDKGGECGLVVGVTSSSESLDGGRIGKGGSRRGLNELQRHVHVEDPFTTPCSARQGPCLGAEPLHSVAGEYQCNTVDRPMAMPSAP